MNPFLRAFAYLLYFALLLPVIVTVGSSFTAGDYLQFPPNGLSLRWYQAFFQDHEMMNGLWLSTLVAITSVAICVPVGATAAVFVMGMPLRWRNLLVSLFLSPLSVPLVLSGFGLLVLFTQLKLINAYGLVIGHAVICVPYVLRTALASMSLQDPSLPRAAAVFGAKPSQTLRYVTIPLMRPGLVPGALFVFLSSFNNVVTSVFIAPTGASTLPVVIFGRMDQLAQPSIAAASALTIGITAILCLFIEHRYELFRSLGS